MGSRNTGKQGTRALRIAGASRVSGHIVGTAQWSPDGALWVDYPGNVLGPLPARTTVSSDLLRAALVQGRADALLVFERELADQPVLVGLLCPPVHAPSPDEAASVDAGSVGLAKEALVDGKRVVLEAKDEIVLRCGEASITLRRNGRVVIRGTYLETRSKGVHRIKGGSVQIN